MKPKLLIVVNKDLRMSYGKLAAQIVHGLVPVLLHSGREMLDAWKQNGYKVVCLQATETELKSILQDSAKSFKGRLYPIFDAGRTEIPPHSFTVLSCDLVDEASTFLNHLKLL